MSQSGLTSKGGRTADALGDKTAVCVALLLELDGGPGLFEVGLELVGLLAVDALLDGLGSLVDERLGLLQAQAGGRPHDLDDLDLLVAGRLQDDVERALLLRRLAGAVTP